MRYKMKGSGESNVISLQGNLHPNKFYLSSSYKRNSFVLDFLTDSNASKQWGHEGGRFG